MYSILVEINNGSIPNHIDYNLELFMWAEIMEAIDDLGYLKGISIYYYGDDEWFDETIHSVEPKLPQLTNAGVEFLKDNFAWNKAYCGMTNVNGWLEI